MHAMLSRWFNVVVALLWGSLLIVLLQSTRPFPTIELSVGMLLGLIAGYLQNRAISARKAPLVLMWVNGVGLLLWAMAFAPDMFLGAWLVGVAAFGLARELTAFLGAPGRHLRPSP